MYSDSLMSYYELPRLHVEELYLAENKSAELRDTQNYQLMREMLPDENIF